MQYTSDVLVYERLPNQTMAETVARAYGLAETQGASALHGITMHRAGECSNTITVLFMRPASPMEERQQLGCYG